MDKKIIIGIVMMLISIGLFSGCADKYNSRKYDEHDTEGRQLEWKIISTSNNSIVSSVEWYKQKIDANKTEVYLSSMTHWTQAIDFKGLYDFDLNRTVKISYYIEKYFKHVFLKYPPKLEYKWHWETKNYWKHYITDVEYFE